MDGGFMKKILLFLTLMNLGSNFAFIGLPTRAGSNIALYAENKITSLKNDPQGQQLAKRAAFGWATSWGIFFGAQKYLPQMGTVGLGKWRIPIKPIAAFIASESVRCAPLVSMYTHKDKGNA